MTEPDFEQIARDTCEETGIGRLEEWDECDPDRVLSAIVNALRHVWNARGAADIEAVEMLESDPRGDAISGIYDVLPAIKALDR